MERKNPYPYSMNGALTLRGFSIQKSGKWKTRRFHGRRSVTPMRHKGRRAVAKTRCHHKAEKKISHELPVREHTGSLHDGERQGENEDKHSEDQKRQGHEDSSGSGKREDTEIHEEAIGLGNSEHSEQSVHPGSIQELRELPASAQVTDETSPEEEEPPF